MYLIYIGNSVLYDSRLKFQEEIYNHTKALIRENMDLLEIHSYCIGDRFSVTLVENSSMSEQLILGCIYVLLVSS